MAARPIVTLLTDFGQRDPFAGIMKGVILGGCPEAQIVDLTHEISAFDIRGASVLWGSALPFFPAGTVHVAVVDPGVGGPRRALLAEIEGRLLLAPDNGLLTCPLMSTETPRIWSLSAAQYWRQPVSPSFHGRDVFAPVAGALAAGVPPDAMGSRVSDPVRLAWPSPGREDAGRIRGEILWIDRFGNCLTNLRGVDVEGWEQEPMVLEVRGAVFGRIVTHFAAVPVGEAAGLVGSGGYLELFVNRGNCAAQWRLAVGARVVVRVERMSPPWK